MEKIIKSPKRLHDKESQSQQKNTIILQDILQKKLQQVYQEEIFSLGFYCS